MSDGAAPAPAATSKPIRLVIRCDKCGGAREAHFPLGAFTPKVIELLGQLLDGSSTYYTQPHGPDSPFGRCTKCGGRFIARVL